MSTTGVRRATARARTILCRMAKLTCSPENPTGESYPFSSSITCSNAYQRVLQVRAHFTPYVQTVYGQSIPTPNEQGLVFARCLYAVYTQVRASRFGVLTSKKATHKCIYNT